MDSGLWRQLTTPKALLWLEATLEREGQEHTPEGRSRLARCPALTLRLQGSQDKPSLEEPVLGPLTTGLAWPSGCCALSLHQGMQRTEEVCELNNHVSLDQNPPLPRSVSLAVNIMASDWMTPSPSQLSPAWQLHKQHQTDISPESSDPTSALGLYGSTVSSSSAS